MLHSHRYPNCCGARVIANFDAPTDPVFDGHHETCLEMFKALVKEEQRYYIECILTGRQNKQWKDHLAEAGFINHYSYKNPGTGRVLYVWHRPSTPPRSRKKSVVAQPTAA